MKTLAPYEMWVVQWEQDGETRIRVFDDFEDMNGFVCAVDWTLYWWSLTDGTSGTAGTC